MIVAEYIARYLQKIGITHVFGYDGSMMLKIADEISYLPDVNFYQGFHEQASSFAADGYARVTGQMGVVLVTSGPGAVNAMAGCCDAFLDSIPLLMITGQDRYTHIATNPGVRLNGFQDMDIVSMARPITKYAVQITTGMDIAYEIEKCVFLANEGRKGPVLLDVPMDIQFEEVPEDVKHFVPEEKEMPLDISTANKIMTVLCGAKQPLILAGGGIDIADARQELKEFVEMTKIPVVTTLNGHDACDISLGSSGLYGKPEANLAVCNCDVLLCLGSRFGLQQTGKLPDEYTKAKIIHIDIDEKEFGRIMEPYISLHCDVKVFLNCALRIGRAYSFPSYDLWLRKIAGWQGRYKNDLYVNTLGVDPVKLVQHIGEVCSDTAIFTNDVGQNTMWVCQGLEIKGRQRLLTSSGYASMGFSLPAAIGAKMAKPANQVISFSGDGGFHMNMQELQFVQLHGLNIKFVIFNNNTLGMMREVQRIYYKNNYVGSNTKEFVCVNLKKVADLYELDYAVVVSNEDYGALDEALKSDKAAIIEIKMPEETYCRNLYDFKRDNPEEFA